MPQAQATKEGQERTLATPKRDQVTQPRVSTTDPQARVVKMPDGGFRPAYNVELATDRAKGIIVGVSVIREGTDAGQALPMEEQVVKRTGQHPQDYLMDGGFATREDITALEERNVTVYSPVRLPRNKPEEEGYQPHYGDTPPSSAVASAYGHGGSQGRIPRARLHRRMGQCPGEPAWGVPIHRPGAGQGHLGNAFGGSGS